MRKEERMRKTHSLLADDADVLRMRVESVESDVC